MTDMAEMIGQEADRLRKEFGLSELPREGPASPLSLAADLLEEWRGLPDACQDESDEVASAVEFHSSPIPVTIAALPAGELRQRHTGCWAGWWAWFVDGRRVSRHCQTVDEIEALVRRRAYVALRALELPLGEAARRLVRQSV